MFYSLVQILTFILTLCLSILIRSTFGISGLRQTMEIHIICYILTTHLIKTYSNYIYET